MRKSLLFIILAAPALLLTACDEGDIVESTHATQADAFTAVFSGDVTGLSSWPEGYDIVVAAFNDDSDYSILQKQVVATGGATSLILSGIPTTARSLEFCVTNKLRRRVLTFERVGIDPAKQSTADTLRLTLPHPIDVGMFASIQRYVFDGTAYNCSLCHGQENGRAGLDLTAAGSYSNLVNKASTRQEGHLRVEPGNSAASTLHEALQEGNPAALRYDHSGLVDDLIRRLIDDWIDGGAKE